MAVLVLSVPARATSWPLLLQISVQSHFPGKFLLTSDCSITDELGSPDLLQAPPQAHVTSASMMINTDCRLAGSSVTSENGCEGLSGPQCPGKTPSKRVWYHHTGWSSGMNRR